MSLTVTVWLARRSRAPGVAVRRCATTLVTVKRSTPVALAPGAIGFSSGPAVLRAGAVSDASLVVEFLS